MTELSPSFTVVCRDLSPSLNMCFDALNENKYFTDCVNDSAKSILPQKLSRKEAALVPAHFLVLEDDMLSSALLPFDELINIH